MITCSLKRKQRARLRMWTLEQMSHGNLRVCCSDLPLADFCEKCHYLTAFSYNAFGICSTFKLQPCFPRTALGQWLSIQDPSKLSLSGASNVWLRSSLNYIVVWDSSYTVLFHICFPFRYQKTLSEDSPNLLLVSVFTLHKHHSQ